MLALLGFGSVFYQRPASAQAASSARQAPPLDRIVQGVEQRQAENHAAAKPYSIVREYRLFSSESTEQPDSVVVARVDFLPPGQTSYEILQSSGNSRGVGIVHRVLDNESEIHKDPQTYGINGANYQFTYEGEQAVDGHRCYMLALEPRRKDHRLLNGRAWVDAESFQVRLIQGEPAKTPSWWLKKVQLTMHYGDMGGVWAPVSTQAVAEVRWFGKRVFTSRELSGQVGSTVAETRTPRNLVETRSPSKLNAKPAAGWSRGHGTPRPTGTVPTVVGIDIPRF